MYNLSKNLLSAINYGFSIRIEVAEVGERYVYEYILHRNTAIQSDLIEKIILNRLARAK